MKKWIALLLAAVMCFSLVACGGRETPNTDNNSGTQQNEQADIESTENNEKDSIASESESTQPDNSSAFLPYVCGEWKVLYIKDEVHDLI